MSTSHDALVPPKNFVGLLYLEATRLSATTGTLELRGTR